MSAWSASSRFVVCNGESVDVSGLTGRRLVSKIKEIAKEANISKFDLYDATGAQVEAADVEAGNFTGNLTIAKYNVAA